MVENKRISLEGDEMIQGIPLKPIPAGCFQMGSMGSVDSLNNERPVHTVTLPAFEMGVYEITQGQYKALTESNPSFFTGDDNLPVEQVTWWDAIKFCNALSAKAGLPLCYDENSGSCDFSMNGFRLPTEAEWEYACRAGSATRYSLGDTEDDLARAGWYDNNSNSKTHPVGGKMPNAWGLYDMHGNVVEWCNDWYGDYLKGNQNNPSGALKGSFRVMRGGGWYSGATHCRSSHRIIRTQNDWYDSIGFRVVRGLPT